MTPTQRALGAGGAARRAPTLTGLLRLHQSTFLFLTRISYHKWKRGASQRLVRTGATGKGYWITLGLDLPS